VLYAAVGPVLTQYDLDREHATLTARGSVTLPANVQEVAEHPTSRYLYVAWSDGGASFAAFNGVPRKGNRHGITTFRIDSTTGALSVDGNAASLPSRPIYITTDVDGTHTVTAENDPSGLTVHQILPDGTLGTIVQQPTGLDFGTYGHQVRVDPTNRSVLMPTRGNAPTATKPEDPGAIKVFAYRQGRLANRFSIAPNGGFGYQVRHLDFHPSGKWVFVTLEPQNQLQVYRRMADGTLGTTPLFVKDTLADPKNVRPTQTASTIHVHPNGRFVYVANRAYGTVDDHGQQVFAGGENTIAVFAIDQQTGEPTLIQSIDTHGALPRTFSLDAAGQFLVVANQTPIAVRDAEDVKQIAAGLSLYRIREDGKLDFTRKYAVDTTADRVLFWAGFETLP
jgi:6-phosphogluconolactonase (cycloisomerase 2 family)